VKYPAQRINARRDPRSLGQPIISPSMRTRVPAAGDSLVLYFIQQYNRGIPDYYRIGDQQCPGLSARQLGHPVPRVKRFSGKLICESKGFLRHGSDLPAAPDRIVDLQELLPHCLILSLRSGSSAIFIPQQKNGTKMKRITYSLQYATTLYSPRCRSADEN